MDGPTYGRTYGQTVSPGVLQDFVPFESAAQKGPYRLKIYDLKIILMQKRFLSFSYIAPFYFFLAFFLHFRTPYDSKRFTFDLETGKNILVLGCLYRKLFKESQHETLQTTMVYKLYIAFLTVLKSVGFFSIEHMGSMGLKINITKTQNRKA